MMLHLRSAVTERHCGSRVANKPRDRDNVNRGLDGIRIRQALGHSHVGPTVRTFSGHPLTADDCSSLHQL
jgi:hypothetical protein